MALILRVEVRLIGRLPWYKAKLLSLVYFLDYSLLMAAFLIN